jgi:hypothetical protein
LRSILCPGRGRIVDRRHLDFLCVLRWLEREGGRIQCRGQVPFEEIDGQLRAALAIFERRDKPPRQAIADRDPQIGVGDLAAKCEAIALQAVDRLAALVDTALNLRAELPGWIVQMNSASGGVKP